MEPTASGRWFRSLLSNISDTVSITDAQGELLFTSEADHHLLGYGEDFWMGRPPISLVHPDDMPRALAAWERALAQPGVEVSEEVRMQSADGSWQDVAITGVNLLDDPDVGGIVVTSRNVTDLRRAERLATSQSEVLEVIARGGSLAIGGERVRAADGRQRGGRTGVHLPARGRPVGALRRRRRRRRSPSGCARPSAAPTAASATGPSRPSARSS